MFAGRGLETTFTFLKMASTKLARYKNIRTFFCLPREDVIFQHIFSHLDIIQLFLCRRVCKLFKELCDAYFNVCKCLNCVPAAGRITESAFDFMTRENTNLQDIVLKHCKGWLKDNSFIRVIRRSHRLKKIDLTGCSSLTNTSLFSLAHCCSFLKNLTLRECRWVSTEALIQLAMGCKQLEFIDLTGCWQVSDNCVCLLASTCTGLRVIVLNDCYSISNASAETIAKSCPGVIHIGIRGCWRVTDTAVYLIGEYCRKLRSLEVKDCRDVTEISLSRLRVRGVQIDVPQPSRMQRWINHLGDGINYEQKWNIPAINLNI